MARIPRTTQVIFGNNSGFQQMGQFGSLFNGTPVYSTDPSVISNTANWQVGWYDAVDGENAPAIQDMNAVNYVNSSYLGYLYQQGLAEWDAGTTYYAGSLVSYPVYTFTITSASATVGATYTNNGQTFTVQSTIVSATSLVCTGTGLPTASGTLTKASGTGAATITFSANSFSTGIYSSIADTNLNNRPNVTASWLPVVPVLGSAYQHLAVNSTGTASEYTYNTFNVRTAPANLTVPAGYNLSTGFLTIPVGITYTVPGTMGCIGPLVVTGTLNVTGTVRVV